MYVCIVIIIIFIFIIFLDHSEFWVNNDVSPFPGKESISKIVQLTAVGSSGQLRFKQARKLGQFGNLPSDTNQWLFTETFLRYHQRLNFLHFPGKERLQQIALHFKLWVRGSDLKSGRPFSQFSSSASCGTPC